MTMTPEIQALIMEDGNSLEIGQLAESQGVNNLRKSGLLKVIQGMTSLEEVNRVTKG